MTAAAVVVRRVNSVPLRTAGATWNVIVDLLARAGTPEHAELRSAAAAASMVISEQITGITPIVVTADSGPRIRIYTLHGDRALDESQDETSLPAQPCATAGWKLQLPCLPSDLDDVTAALGGCSHVEAYSPDAGASTDTSTDTSPSRRSGLLVVDRNALDVP